MRRQIDSLLPFLQQDPPSGGDPVPDPKNQDPPGDPAKGTEDPPKPFMTFPDEASWTARLKRESRSHLDEEAKKLGYESHQAMIDAAKAVKDQEAAQQTELDQAKARADAAEAASRDALSTANNRLILAEVKSLCTDEDIKIIDADAAYALMDHADVEVSDSGVVTGVKESLSKLIADKPYLKVAGDPPNGVPRTPRPVGDKPKDSVAGAYLKSKRYGPAQ